MERLELTREEAIKEHRKMWNLMGKTLGEFSKYEKRMQFKKAYIKRHFPGKLVKHNCFLCAYAVSKKLEEDAKNGIDYFENDITEDFCKYCPLDFLPDDNDTDHFCDVGEISHVYSSCFDVANAEEREDNK